MALPVIIDPFSSSADEIAGTTPEELALNLRAGTRVALSWRAKLRRPVPNLRALFKGCLLSPEAKEALREVDAEYQRLTKRQPKFSPALPVVAAPSEAGAVAGPSGKERARADYASFEFANAGGVL